jgi:hypothetical protein
MSFDGERPGFRVSPPKLGAHTDEIFGDASRKPQSSERNLNRGRHR